MNPPPRFDPDAAMLVLSKEAGRDYMELTGTSGEVNVKEVLRRMVPFARCARPVTSEEVVGGTAVVVEG